MVSDQKRIDFKFTKEEILPPPTRNPRKTDWKAYAAKVKSFLNEQLPSQPSYDTPTALREPWR